MKKEMEKKKKNSTTRYCQQEEDSFAIPIREPKKKTTQMIKH